MKFCEEYLVDFNGSAAARRAGYSEKTANEQATRLLAKVHIKQRIKELTDRDEERSGITRKFILNSLKEVALRCMERIPVMERDENGNYQQKIDADGNHVWQFNATGANKALELLGKHLGLFNEKVPLFNVPNNVKMTFTIEDVKEAVKKDPFLNVIEINDEDTLPRAAELCGDDPGVT